MSLKRIIGESGASGDTAIDEKEGDTSKISFLECEVCFHKFDDKVRVPRLLLCGHTFCEVCLESLAMNNLIRCPNNDGHTAIGKEGGGVQDLKKNYALLKLLCDLTPRSDVANDEQRCENDCQDPATKFCKECGCRLCGRCAKQIHKIAILKGHTIVDGTTPAAQKALSCDEHGHDLMLFCKNEQICICPICAFSAHKGHDIDPISAVVDQHRDQIKLWSGKLKEEEERLFSISHKLSKDDKSLEKNRSKTVKQVNALFNQFKAVVDQAQQNAVKVIEDQANTKDSALQSCRETFASHISEISTCIEAAKRVSLCDSDLVFLSKYPALLKQMKEVEKDSSSKRHDEQDLNIKVSAGRYPVTIACKKVQHSLQGDQRDTSVVSWLLPIQPGNRPELEVQFVQESSMAEEITTDDITTGDIAMKELPACVKYCRTYPRTGSPNLTDIRQLEIGRFKTFRGVIDQLAKRQKSDIRFWYQSKEKQKRDGVVEDDEKTEEFESGVKIGYKWKAARPSDLLRPLESWGFSSEEFLMFEEKKSEENFWSRNAIKQNWTDFEVEDVLDVLDANYKQKNWYQSGIIKVRDDKSKIYIHYIGWESEYDEWIGTGEDVGRLAKLRSRSIVVSIQTARDAFAKHILNERKLVPK